ncbi:MAG: type II toxin-antitoxin system ParD family antitoxin [Mesorhizobium sp.]|nr:type II toxin-antitoxin system ParD family antitoxin [Mesorhizobium sp.]
MNANVSIKVELPADLAEAMRLKVEAGEYASAGDMLQAGLRSLLESDRALENWLREDVVAGHAEYLANPRKAIPAEDVLAHLRDRRARLRTTP